MYNYMYLYNTTCCHTLLHAVYEFYTRCNNRELWLCTRGYALLEEKCCVSIFSPNFH